MVNARARMPSMPPPRRPKIRYPSLEKPKREDDRAFRQIENYYRRRGYAPERIEQHAEDDLQLIKGLQGRRRGRKPLPLTGIDN